MNQYVNICVCLRVCVVCVFDSSLICTDSHIFFNYLSATHKRGCTPEPKGKRARGRVDFILEISHTLFRLLDVTQYNMYARA